MTSNGAALYPRSYSASFGWKLFLALLGFPLGIGGLAGVWYFSTGHEIHNGTQMVVFVGISLAMAALGFWCAFGTLLAKILVLTQEELQVPGIFRTTVIRRSDISGYRVLNVQGFNVLELEFTKSDSTKKKRTKITMLFKPDEAFTAWFKGISNFDAIELAASVQEIEKDAQLGRSPEERLDNVNRARKIARALHFGSLAVAGWAIFYPRPYTAMFVVVAALPWIALWLCWKYKGLFSVDDPGRNSVRADLTAMVLMPGAVLAIRALADVRLIDATTLIVPTLVGLGFMLACVAWIAPVYRTNLLKLTLITLLLFAYPASSIAIANALFDQSAPDTYRLQVLQKRHTSGKGASQYFKVPAWGPYTGTNEVQVARDLYHQTETGQTVCVLRHPGALGLEWYSVRALHAC